MTDWLHVVVDKATFLEVGRVFKRVYRPAGASEVIFTLGNGRLRIEFSGGGSELRCDNTQSLVAEISARSFARIMAEYQHEKSLEGMITLTFRPRRGEFATRLAGAKAKFRHWNPAS